MAKVELHIPTEQYGFVAIEMEGDPETVVEAYRSWAQAFKPKEGIPDRDFNAFIDRQLMGGTNHVEEYQLMSPEQQGIVQAVKRALKRLESKYERSS